MFKIKSPMRIRRKDDVLTATKLESRIETAAGSGYGGGQVSGTGSGGHLAARAFGAGADAEDSVLKDVVDLQNRDVLYSILRDCYLHDPILGGGADLWAMLPWSKATLSGGTDEQLQPFYENMERLNYERLMQSSSLDTVVLGTFVGTPVYSEDIHGFTDIIPHSIASCEITETPLWSADPLIQLNVPDELKNFASNTTTYAKKIQERVPKAMLKSFGQDSVWLDPMSTVYVPKPTFSTVQVGTSMYMRALPIYLVERLLFRGTLSESARRQRSTLHIRAGDDLWEPNDEELLSLVQLFLQAEQDPISATVATGHNVVTEEIRPAGEFWRWSDDMQIFSEMKLKSLGLNEALLSGDSSLANLDGAITILNEQLDGFRNYQTAKLFYHKLFPAISIMNGIKPTDQTATLSKKELRKKSKKGKNPMAMFTASGDSHRGLVSNNAVRPKMDRRVTETAASGDKDTITQNFGYDINDSQNLFLPDIHWEKQLVTHVDENRLNVLDRLRESGVPVPLRMLAASGGINLDKLMDGVKEDEEIRKEIEKLTGRKSVETLQYEQLVNEASEPEETASIWENNFTSATEDILCGDEKAPKFLDRDFKETAEVFRKGKGKRKHHIPNQNEAMRNQDEEIAKALRRHDNAKI